MPIQVKGKVSHIATDGQSKVKAKQSADSLYNFGTDIIEDNASNSSSIVALASVSSKRVHPAVA